MSRRHKNIFAQPSPPLLNIQTPLVSRAMTGIRGGGGSGDGAATRKRRACCLTGRGRSVRWCRTPPSVRGGGLGWEGVPIRQSSLSDPPVEKPPFLRIDFGHPQNLLGGARDTIRDALSLPLGWEHSSPFPLGGARRPQAVAGGGCTPTSPPDRRWPPGHGAWDPPVPPLIYWGVCGCASYLPCN